MLRIGLGYSEVRARIWVSRDWLYWRSFCSSVWSFFTSVSRKVISARSFWISAEVAAGRTWGSWGAGACVDCGGAPLAAVRGLKASARARGQADSVAVVGWPDGGTAAMGRGAGGAGANSWLSAALGAGVLLRPDNSAFFGCKRLFTRRINSCG